jgi:hypothetical protein
MSDLAPDQMDMNFWFLYSAVLALQSAGSGADIDYFVVTGNQMFVHLTNHAVLGPYILPTAQWNFRDAWAPVTSYGALDVVSDDGSLYIVIWPHTSQAAFSAVANDGSGHYYYSLLLAQPANMIPAGGIASQRLAKVNSTDFNTLWVSDYRNLGLFIQGQPAASELLLRYSNADTALTLPAGLSRSVAGSGTAAAAPAVFDLAQNGAPIGSITFNTDGSVTFSFTGAITLVPGDVLTITAPATPDATLADLSITLQATISG